MRLIINSMISLLSVPRRLSGFVCLPVCDRSRITKTSCGSIFMRFLGQWIIISFLCYSGCISRNFSFSPIYTIIAVVSYQKHHTMHLPTPLTCCKYCTATVVTCSLHVKIVAVQYLQQVVMYLFLMCASSWDWPKLFISSVTLSYEMFLSK